MKKKLKNTFTGVIILMAVITFFSFQLSTKPYRIVTTKICTIPNETPRIDLYFG